MSDGATDYSPFGNAVCAREAHQYIILYLPAFVNRMLSNYADYHYDRNRVSLRETHTHAIFLTHSFIMS